MLDKITEPAFKENDKGEIVFYRWGLMGRAYVLPDLKAKQHLSAFLKSYYIVIILVLLVIYDSTWSIIGMTSLALFLVYAVVTHQYVQNFPTVSTKHESYNEHMMHSVKHYSPTLLYVLLVSSLSMLILGLVCIFFIKGGLQMGIAASLFFGITSVAFVYLIKIKQKQLSKDKLQSTEF